MKKKILFVALSMSIMAFLSGCHEHTWKEATCESPKTCSECGKTEGEALEHDYLDATCVEPQKCSRCGKTNGTPLGHNWIPATCTEPKICSVCGETEGEPKGHQELYAKCDICGLNLKSELEPGSISSDFFENVDLIGHDLSEIGVDTSIASDWALEHNIFTLDSELWGKKGYISVNAGWDKKTITDVNFYFDSFLFSQEFESYLNDFKQKYEVVHEERYDAWFKYDKDRELHVGTFCVSISWNDDKQEKFDSQNPDTIDYTPDPTPTPEIKKYNPQIGMSEDDVLDSSWGAPKKKNRTTTSYGVEEQWVYNNNRYIYFENGYVTAIQDFSD